MLAKWGVASNELAAVIVVLLNPRNKVRRVKVYTRATVVGVDVIKLLVRKFVQEERLLCRCRHCDVMSAATRGLTMLVTKRRNGSSSPQRWKYDQ